MTTLLALFFFDGMSEADVIIPDTWTPEATAGGSWSSVSSAGGTWTPETPASGTWT